MANQGHKSSKDPTAIVQDQRPRSLKYYLSGGKNYSRKLGKYATKGYSHAKDFIAKEIREISAVPSMLKPIDKLDESGSVIKSDKQTLGQQRPQQTSEKVESNEPSLSTGDKDDDAVNDNDSLLVPDGGKKKQKTIDEIKKLTKRSNEVLCSAISVFPFSLFRDKVVLDRTKLTITKHDFFMSSNVMSIRIEDILNVTSDVGPFLGSINVAIRIMNSDDHISVNNLKRTDAIHLKHIIQGYVIAQHNKIDVAHLNRNELIETLTELGHDANS